MPRTFHTLLVLDFEATCGDTEIPRNEMEVIEFPTLVYDIKTKRVTDTFHEYVKPLRHPTLTNFCTELTGIQQETVDAASPFPEVWARFNAFLKEKGVFEDPDAYCFLTCGNWDLETLLPSQLDYSRSTGAEIEPAHDIFTRWINVKTAFKNLNGLRQMKGMTGMLSYLKLPLVGRHHSGIDDCRNIAAIVKRLQETAKWNAGRSQFSTIRPPRA